MRNGRTSQRAKRCQGFRHVLALLPDDVEQFGRTNPTIENIAVFAWNRLADKFPKAALHRVTVWETDKTYCTYSG